MISAFPSVDLVAGKEYKLCINTPGPFNSLKNVTAMYVGQSPVVTPSYFRVDRPEGHQFVCLNGSGKVETYISRTIGSLTELWLSDGEDEPSYPVGIRVEKLEFNRSKSEEEFLVSRLQSTEMRLVA